MLPTSLGKYKLRRVNEIEYLDKYYHNIMRNLRGCGVANIRKRDIEREREGGGEEKGRKKRKEGKKPLKGR